MEMSREPPPTASLGPLTTHLKLSSEPPQPYRPLKPPEPPPSPPVLPDVTTPLVSPPSRPLSPPQASTLALPALLSTFEAPPSPECPIEISRVPPSP